MRTSFYKTVAMPDPHSAEIPIDDVVGPGFPQEVFPMNAFLRRAAQYAAFNAVTSLLSHLVMLQSTATVVRYQEGDARNSLDELLALHPHGVELKEQLESALRQITEQRAQLQAFLSQSDRGDSVAFMQKLTELDAIMNSTYAVDAAIMRNFHEMVRVILPCSFEDTRPAIAITGKRLWQDPMAVKTNVMFQQDRLEKFKPVLMHSVANIDSFLRRVEGLSRPFQGGVPGDFMMAARYAGPLFSLSFGPLAALLSIPISLGTALAVGVAVNREWIPPSWAARNLDLLLQGCSLVGTVGGTWLLSQMDVLNGTPVIFSDSLVSPLSVPSLLYDPASLLTEGYPARALASCPSLIVPDTDPFNTTAYASARAATSTFERVSLLTLNCTEVSAPHFVDPEPVPRNWLPEIRSTAPRPTGTYGATVHPNDTDISAGTAQYIFGVTILQVGMTLLRCFGGASLPIVWLGLMVMNGLVVVRDARYLANRLHTLLEKLPSHRFDDLGGDSDA